MFVVPDESDFSAEDLLSESLFVELVSLLTDAVVAVMVAVVGVDDTVVVIGVSMGGFVERSASFTVAIVPLAPAVVCGVRGGGVELTSTLNERKN